MHLTRRLIDPATLTEVNMPGCPGYARPSGNEELQWMVTYAGILSPPRPVPTWITIPEAKLLTKLAKGQKILEIGSSFGFSTIAMAKVAEHVDAVDPHPEYFGRINPGSLDSLQFAAEEHDVADRIMIYRDYSYNVLPEMKKHAYDLAFVDADHSKSAVLTDAEMVLPLVKPGGHLAFHDYDEDCWPGVAQALDKIFSPGTGQVTGTLWVKQVAQ